MVGSSFRRGLSLFVFAAIFVPATAETRELRHEDNQSPKEKNVDSAEMYDTNLMSLMQSPCRPERDGFFGSTSGEPIELEYGFKLEMMPLAPFRNIMEAVTETLVDEVLATSFPQVCGFRRRKLGRASGFWFGPLKEVSRKLGR
jgi:hypothetical protein